VGTSEPNVFAGVHASALMKTLAGTRERKRVKKLEAVFTVFRDAPHWLGEVYHAEEVVAAAAVVAATLPGGDPFALQWRQMRFQSPSESLLPEPVPHLAGSAHDAVLRVAAPGATTDLLLRVLAAGRSGQG
jgi:hypothetical protein